MSQFQTSDSWHEPTGSEGDEVVRVHDRPRRSLFTPMRVEGSPPAKVLAGTRRTEGKFLDNGESFTIVDEWRGRREPHRDLSRPWVGKTVFMLRTPADANSANMHAIHNNATATTTRVSNATTSRVANTSIDQ